jgi:hypothetical protein
MTVKHEVRDYFISVVKVERDVVYVVGTRGGTEHVRLSSSHRNTYLNRELAGKLAIILQAFADTGELPGADACCITFENVIDMIRNPGGGTTLTIAAYVPRGEVLSLRFGTWSTWLRGTDGVLATVEPLRYDCAPPGEANVVSSLYYWRVLGTCTEGVARTEQEARDAAERQLRRAGVL